MTWGWRKLLHLRPIIRVLFGIVLNRALRAGFKAVTKVRDIALDDSWHFPSKWHSKYLNLNMPTVPLFTDLEDVLELRDLKGGVHPFLVSIAWDCIRPRQDKVDWSDVVWFSNYILRHSFHLWLVIRPNLRIQDILIHSNAPLLCSLCERTPDSYDHLFFECVFSNQVWDHLKVLAGLNEVSASFASIMLHLVPISKQRHARSVIAKIVFAACSYYIW
ncbi:reverse transcriptase domain, reverse transcriptase zinc-binding domain protein [Tanacetum coccineum]